MKKIFYILTAAVVALGAMACENEGLENVAPEANGEGLTITATVSRVAWSEENLVPTAWEPTDVITIEGYDFTTTDGTNFTCNDAGVYDLCDGQPHVATTPFDSTKGLKGVSLTAEGVITVEGTSLTFTPASALLTFTAESAITLEATAGLFSGDATKLEFAAGTHYVAVNPTIATLQGAIGRLKEGSYTAVTATEGTFVAGEVYNLGTLAAQSEWEVSDGTRFYCTTTEDLFVAKNVKLAADNFCLHKVGDAGWQAGAKYGLVTAATKSVNTAIGIYTANWAGDITITGAKTTAHDIYFDKANSRLYVLTVGKQPSEIAAPTHTNWYSIGGSMNGWGSTTAPYKFTYSGDGVWHTIVDFKANDEFKVKLNNDWGTSYGHGQTQANVGKSLSSGSDNFKVKTAGTYEIWVIPAHSDAPLYILKK